MTSYALLLGIDAYAQESGLRPLTSAVSAVRRFAAWLDQQGWVEPEHIRLLCSPHGPGEAPTTRSSIGDALVELQQRGKHAQPDDRLYVMFAGYGAGYSADQILLLPEDVTAGKYDEQAIPWSELARWLRGSGFQTQLCFIAIAQAEDESLSDALADTRLPLNHLQPGPEPAGLRQHLLLSTGLTDKDPAAEPVTIFSSALHAALAGAAATSVDPAKAEQVVRINALGSYLEDELPHLSSGRQRYTMLGPTGDNLIVARLGPAPGATLRIEIEPAEAAAQATVAIYDYDSEMALDVLEGPLFQFEVLQDGLYVLVARAPEYQEEARYVRAATEPITLRLRRSGEGVLSARSRALAELLIQPEDPVLPVQLVNSYNMLIPLPPRRSRGYVVKTPPDRYRARLITPERNIEREVEARAREVTLLPLPLDNSRQLRPLDRLLTALERGQILDVRLSPTQSALVVLAEGTPMPLPHMQGYSGEQQLVAPAQVPADVVGLLRHSFVGAPGQMWLLLHSADGELFYLLVPLLPGRVTVVGLDTTNTILPVIELLVVEAPFLRRHIAAQKRVLWAQRFVRAERTSFLPALVDETDDQPLALILAGYTALYAGDARRTRALAQRLLAVAPAAGDGPILMAGAQGLEQAGLIDGPPLAQLPMMLKGLLYLAAFAAPRMQQPLVPSLRQSALLTQMWVVVRGTLPPSTNLSPLQQNLPLHESDRPLTAEPRAPQPTTYEALEGRTLPPVDVLLVTATSVETRAVLDAFVGRRRSIYQRYFAGENTYYDLGTVSGTRTLLVQSEMGSGGPAGAALTIASSITALHPSAIIMVGIAFGIDQGRQPVGTVLVASQILAYELQRVGTGPGHQPQIITRGSRPAASTRLLDRFRGGELEWRGAKVQFGLILSGEKLVDYQPFRDQLQHLAPEAIGGEMEGTGLYAAADRHRIDWILVKAVCDYADGHKAQDKATRQNTAARNAARFVYHVLAQGGLAGDVECGLRAEVPQPRPTPEPAFRAGDGFTATMRQTIDRLFNETELHNLCFDLGIDYETLGGENKSARARELVAYAQRHGLTSLLVDRCRALRPDWQWPST